MQINWLVDNIGPSQLSYALITELNKSDINSTVFYNTLNKYPLRPNFAVMQMVEAWCQPGITVATSLATASQMLEQPGPKHKVYYVWDLPWMRIRPKTYSVVANILTNPNISIVCRSELHYRAIRNAFNIEIKCIIDDFYMKDFIEFFKELQNER